MIEEISLEKYAEVVRANIVYNSWEFNELNRNKVDKIYYLLFSENNKSRFALVCGQAGSVIRCPFSAPFATIVALKSRWTILQLEEAVRDLVVWGKEKHIQSIYLTLPPDFYDKRLIISLTNVLLRYRFQLVYQDINYAFYLGGNRMGDVALFPNARKNLQIALRSNLKFCRCTGFEDKQSAYDIIKQNREYKGYPLRMTWPQVEKTISFVENEFFVVMLGEIKIAAAQVFMVSPEIYQVIYWGDTPGFSEYKPVNFLADQLVKYYKTKNAQYLDVGPSSDYGLPNYGLCDFKTGIGCELSSKLSFEYRYGEEK